MRPSGYEPDELTTAPLRVVISSISHFWVFVKSFSTRKPQDGLVHASGVVMGVWKVLSDDRKPVQLACEEVNSHQWGAEGGL